MTAVAFLVVLAGAPATGAEEPGVVGVGEAVKNAKGVESKVELKVPVSAVAPGAGAAAAKAADKAHSGHGEHKH